MKKMKILWIMRLLHFKNFWSFEGKISQYCWCLKPCALISTVSVTWHFVISVYVAPNYFVLITTDSSQQWQTMGILIDSQLISPLKCYSFILNLMLVEPLEIDSQSLISRPLLSLKCHVVVRPASQLTELRWFTWEPVMVSLGNRLTLPVRVCLCRLILARWTRLRTSGRWSWETWLSSRYRTPSEFLAHYFCCNGSSGVVEVVEVRAIKNAMCLYVWDSDHSHLIE